MELLSGQRTCWKPQMKAELTVAAENDIMWNEDFKLKLCFDIATV